MKRMFALMLLALTPAMLRAEFFIEAYGGGANTYDGSFSAKERRYIGTPSEALVTAEGDLSGSKGSGGGLRGGYWDKNLNWLGGAVDINYFGVDSKDSDADVALISISLLAMLRYPLLISDDFPNGMLYPYVGVGASYVSAHISAEDMGDHNTDGSGVLFCTGVTWMMNRTVGLFVECRIVSMSFEEDESYHRTDLFGHRDYFSYEAEGDVKANLFLTGISLHF